MAFGSFFLTRTERVITHLKAATVDDEIKTSSYFGFICNYTVTRATLFHFMQMNIKAFEPDLSGPKIHKYINK